MGLNVTVYQGLKCGYLHCYENQMLSAWQVLQNGCKCVHPTISCLHTGIQKMLIFCKYLTSVNWAPLPDSPDSPDSDFTPNRVYKIK